MIDDNWKELACKQAQEYCKAHNIKLTTLGARVVGDADFFVDLPKPTKGCNANTLLRVKHWFASNRVNKSKKTKTKN